MRSFSFLTKIKQLIQKNEAPFSSNLNAHSFGFGCDERTTVKWKSRSQPVQFHVVIQIWHGCCRRKYIHLKNFNVDIGFFCPLFHSVPRIDP